MKRHIGFGWLAIIAIGVGTSVTPLVLGSPFSPKKTTAEEKEKKFEEADPDEFDAKTQVPLIGEYTQVVGTTVIVLHGAGLVVGLDSGEDPPPSEAREMVLEDMKRHNVPNPSKLLKSGKFAIVEVIGYLPPLIRKGEHFDVEVMLPPASKVKSLNGGHLLRTYLAEHPIVPKAGQFVGRQYATVEGPILVSASHEKSGKTAGVQRRGRIIAGGKSLYDRNLDLYLRNEFRSVRNSYRIAQAIGARFFEYDEHGMPLAVAKAETDQKIELKVLTKYRDNYPRYLNVIRKIAFRETPLAKQARMRSLRWELLNGETSSQASLKLEAIGEQSIPILKAGLKSKDTEVRFNSAVALAYLNDPSGLDELVDAARKEYAFRVFALAAMATLDDPEVPAKLRELLDADSAETRYGAFRALTTLDKNDPFARGRELNKEFKLHVLATGGPPMVHITNEKKAEIVVFGADQQLRTPLAARAGMQILVTASAGSNKVTISKFEVNRPDQRKVVSARLEEVILTLAEFGATFPDVAQFLAEVNSQKNLAGRLEIDALPRAGRLYERKTLQVAGQTSARKKERIGANMTPNLFNSSDKQTKPAPRKGKEADETDDDRTTGDDDSREVSRKKPKTALDEDGVVPAKGSKGASADKTDTAAIPVDSDTANSTAPAKASLVKPASYEKGADKTKPADNSDAELLDDADKPAAAPAPSRFSWFRFFNFGSSGVSGNKEP